MPRSCSSSDMAGTFMLYPHGTDGAAVTEVRLHGSRSTQRPELRNTRTHWNRGFTALRRCGVKNALDPGSHRVPDACRTQWIRDSTASERTGSGVSSRSSWPGAYEP